MESAFRLWQVVLVPSPFPSGRHARFLGRFATPASAEKVPLFHVAFPGLTRNIVERSRYLLVS